MAYGNVRPVADSPQFLDQLTGYVESSMFLTWLDSVQFAFRCASRDAICGVSTSSVKTAFLRCRGGLKRLRNSGAPRRRVQRVTPDLLVPISDEAMMTEPRMQARMREGNFVAQLIRRLMLLKQRFAAIISPFVPLIMLCRLCMLSVELRKTLSEVLSLLRMIPALCFWVHRQTLMTAVVFVSQTLERSWNVGTLPEARF